MFNLKAGKGSATSLPNAKIQMPYVSADLAATWTSATTVYLDSLRQGSNVMYLWNTGATAGRTYVYVNSSVGYKYTNWDG